MPRPIDLKKVRCRKGSRETSEIRPSHVRLSLARQHVEIHGSPWPFATRPLFQNGANGVLKAARTVHRTQSERCIAFIDATPGGEEHDMRVSALADLALVLVPTPGHTPGSISLLVTRRRCNAAAAVRRSYLFLRPASRRRRAGRRKSPATARKQPSRARIRAAHRSARNSLGARSDGRDPARGDLARKDLTPPDDVRVFRLRSS